MAQGSEQMSWKVWPYQRECAACGRTLRIQDVGEHRTYYKGGKAVQRLIWCTDHRPGLKL
jgi:hypothetical protein